MSEIFSKDGAVRNGRGLMAPVARAGVLAAALALGACAQGEAPGLTLGAGEEPKSTDIATASAGPSGQAELDRATSYWGDQHAKNPRDGKAALAYARNLKALGRKSQALSVMQASYMFNGDNREFLSEYGRLALDAGQVSTAAELLARADDPGKPDWRVTSARGTVLAKQGRYKEAISYFEEARKLAPGQASVLNNLAMALTMDGQAARGEELLRQARQAGGSDPRVRQNLALVLELQGKADEARRLEADGEARPASEAAPATSRPEPQTAASAAAPVTTAQLPAPATGEAAAKPSAAKVKGSKPLDPDQIIKAAMAAEKAKAR
jgi:Flp pilus assembly protein TadD